MPPVGNDMSLPVTNSQVAEDPIPKPKAKDVEIVEDEVIDLSLESGVEHQMDVEPSGGKRKISHDGSEEVKKAGRREVVAPLSGQSLDQIHFKIVEVGLSTHGLHHFR